MRTYRPLSRGPSRGLRPLATALALLFAVGSSLEAQERRYLIEVGAAGLYQSFDSTADLESAAGGAGRIGVWLPYNFSVEVEGFTSPTTTNSGVDVSVRGFTFSALYNILLGNRSWAHLRLGTGATKYLETPCARGGPVICGNPGTLLAGVGARVGLTPDLLARGDLSLSRYSATLESAGNREVNLTNFAFTLGLSYMLGSKPIADSDGDGVLENRDRCPDTPTGAQVDGTGCPSDSDADGVPDGVDRCANTPLGADVNGTGCTQDSDCDNIADGIDRCPDTETGVLVDPNGCPRDSDEDQIPDGLDRCSETPRGATVDALGCPGDEDGDGVLDGLDRCPRTPTGAAINAQGCPTAQGAAPARPAPSRAQRQPPAPQPAAEAPPSATPRPAARASRITPGVLRGVTFAPGSARLGSDAYVQLDSIAEILMADTTVVAEIAAHTDNTGTPSQNQHLTNLQAEAVRTYLVTKGVRFQQVQARGYGATVPLTPDNTPRGRAANRRIEIRPSAPGP
jgi:outer membrane protein OmpA-like peptidoglycan-associated protein